MWQVNESPIETNRLRKPVYRLSNSKVEMLFGTPVLMGIKEAEQLAQIILGPGENFVSVVASFSALNELVRQGWRVVEESVGKLRPASDWSPLFCDERRRAKFKRFKAECYLPGERIERIDEIVCQMKGWSKSFTGSYHRCEVFEKEVVDAVYEQWFFDTLVSTDSVRMLAFCDGLPLTAHTLNWSGGVWKSGFSLTSPSKMTVGASSAAAYGQYPSWTDFLVHHDMLSYMATDNHSQQAFHDRLGYKTAHFRQVLHKSGAN